MNKINENKNVFGENLDICPCKTLTGDKRNNYCQANEKNKEMHTICAVMTMEFLQFTRLRGNDLMTSRNEFGFSGLKPGDYWCLSVTRWLEAYQAGYAPKVKLSSTHIETLEHITLVTLKQYAIDLL